MQKILLVNDDNLRQEVDLIRYFKYKSDFYLIYTLNERDEKDYLKLYLVKVLKELDEYIGYNITDKNEWKEMQNVIKKVIKEIKENKMKNIEDQDKNEISGIRISEPRSFKLDQELVNILMSNYSFSDLDNDEKIVIQDNTNDIVMQPIEQKTEIEDNKEKNNNYKNMYTALKEEKDASDELMNDLLNKLVAYKNKYGDIEGE